MNSPSEARSSRVPLDKSERKSPAQAKSHGPTPPDKEISVSVIVKRKNPLKLAELKGKHISHQTFLSEYAADPAGFEKLKTFATDHGLTVDEAGSSIARRTLKLRGTAAAIEKAFGITLNNYEYPEHAGKHFHGYEGKISLPTVHADLVEAVLGLDSRPIAKPHIRMKKHAQAAQAVSFSPVQVAGLYNFPTNLNGSGQTIGIIGLGGGYTDSDLQQYFQGLGLNTPSVTAVSVDGGSNAPAGDPSSADGEVMLDIEVAGAVANGANIAVYFTANSEQGFQDALTTAVHDTTNKPSVISISWGAPESDWTEQFMTSFDNACQSAGALGVSITVASGDNGSSDGGSGDNVDFPASSPHVLACGGTALYGSGNQISSETVWNDQPQGGGATGGGVSTVFALPTWQANANVPAPAGGSGGRGVPDVAGDASPETGYNIQVDGQQTVVGGTSAVAPLWAGLIALINQQNGSPLGFFNPALYQSGGSGFHDITSGNNGDFSAGPGWDACTGLGSPNGTQLAGVLSASSTGTGGS
jgi:kumamolisin